MEKFFKVYVIYGWSYDSFEIDGVFLNKDKANEYIAKLEKELSSWNYEIETFIINKEEGSLGCSKRI